MASRPDEKPIPSATSSSDPAATASNTPATGPAKRSSLWVLIGCNVLVFMSSVCVMVLELTASRLIAKHVGSSLYTWTSVIGVVLAGITIGNFLGGWLADRAQPSKLLNWLFLTASILCLSVLWLDGIVAEKHRPDNWGWPAWVVWIVGLVFFLPSMSLGTISPVVASLALSHSKKVGLTVGNVYAWGALGSIIGTFLTGFVLIDTLGTRAIVALTAGTLAAMGLLSAAGQWAFRAAVLCGWLQFIVWVGLAAAVTESGMRAAVDPLARAVTISRDPFARSTALARWSEFGERCGKQLHQLGLTLGLRDDALGEYHDESNYSYINVSESTESNGRVTTLKLDKLIHAYFLPDNPTHLNYDYEQVYAAVTEQAVMTRERKTTVSLDAVRKEIRAAQANQRQKNAAVATNDNPGSEDNSTAGANAASETAPRPFRNIDELLAANVLKKSDDSAEADETAPTLAEMCGKLPTWLTFDETAKELSLRGGMTVGQREDLLRRHPYGNYWRAVERLREMTHSGDWGDFGSVPLTKLPSGVTIPEELKHKVLFDRHLQALNVYSQLSDADITLLQQLGSAEAVAYREVIDRLYRESRQVSTLFLGGGGFVFPRWIDTLFPHNPLIHVAELDPGVKAAVQARMGLLPDDQTRVKTTIGDARNFVDDRVRANEVAKKDGRPPVLYDYVYGDAFNDFSVPWHLTTQEFSAKIASLLDPREGIYLVNLIDIYPRTTFPKDSQKPDGSYLVVNGAVPDVLTRNILEAGVWSGAPAPYEGLEVEQSLEEFGYRLGVRGVMSDKLRERLLALEAGSKQFSDAVRQLYDESKKQRAGRFLGAYVNTIIRVFPHVYIFSSEIDLPHDGRDTFVIVASNRKLDLTDLRQSSTHWLGVPFATLETEGGKSIAKGQMPEILALARDIVLTDNFAPVDNLLSTVFDAF